MKITVVGLGKIGLPLAVQYARKGHTVMGADISRRVVDLVNAGTEPFPGEYRLQEYLSEVVASGQLTVTTETSQAVRDSEAVVVAVPLVIDEELRPDFTVIDVATADIGRGLQPGTLVSFETTVPVGTIRTRLTPILECESGLAAGSDFHVVFSPERVFTGRVFEDLRRYPKLVGGIDEASTARGVAFYNSVLDFDERPDLQRPNGVWSLGTAEAAELAKLAETTYRDVNIGLANQFARHAGCIGVDVHSVIEACNSQPFSHIHRPGVAVGGHCIPVYPQLYLWHDPEATIVQAARAVNLEMPTYAVDLLAREFDDLVSATVVVLGAAYRGGVKETGHSGIFPLVAELTNRGAKAMVHDPLYDDEELRSLGLTPWHRGSPADAAIVQADHEQYDSWSPIDIPGVRVVIDGRRALTSESWVGVKLVTIGGEHP